MDIGAIQNAISLLHPQAQQLLPFSAPATENDEVAVFRAVDEALNLTKENRDVFGALENISGGNISTFFETLAELLKAGVIGTEILDLGSGEIDQSFVSGNIADEAIPYVGRNLDIRA